MGTIRLSKTLINALKEVNTTVVYGSHDIIPFTRSRRTRYAGKFSKRTYEKLLELKLINRIITNSGWTSYKYELHITEYGKQELKNLKKEDI